MALNQKELNLFDTIANCLISIENSNLYIKIRVNIINLSSKRCQVNISKFILKYCIIGTLVVLR